MAERKRQKVPHPLLAPWVQAEKGRMTTLVRASGRTWAAVNNIVWHGAMPRGDTARQLAAETGFSVDAIIRGAEEAAVVLREQEDAA